MKMTKTKAKIIKPGVKTYTAPKLTVYGGMAEMTTGGSGRRAEGRWGRFMRRFA